MNDQIIEDKLDELSETSKKEVLDFIEFLISKNRKDAKKSNLDFSWEGGLSAYKGQYTSVDLQHQSSEWR